MANTKLMREALQAIQDFWREGNGPLVPWAQISEGEETISELVNRALNTDSDARTDQPDGDVHVTNHRTAAVRVGGVVANQAETWVEFDLRSLRAENWWDELSHPIKHATNPTGKGNDFRARPDDAEVIIGLMESAGLEVRDYR